MINRINIFAEPRDVFTDGRSTFKLPKQGNQNMPKKNPNLNVVGTAKSIRDTSFKVIHDPSEPVVFTPKNKKEKAG